MAMRTVGQIKQNLTLKEVWKWARLRTHPGDAIEALVYSQGFVRTCVTDFDYPKSFYSVIEEVNLDKDSQNID